MLIVMAEAGRIGGEVCRSLYLKESPVSHEQVARIVIVSKSRKPGKWTSTSLEVVIIIMGFHPMFSAGCMHRAQSAVQQHSLPAMPY